MVGCEEWGFYGEFWFSIDKGCFRFSSGFIFILVGRFGVRLGVLGWYRGFIGVVVNVKEVVLGI